jgi:menaquinol-cytochrome c reductase iron-sulfur subunit
LSTPEETSLEDRDMSRRGFFTFLCYAMGGVAAATIAIPLTGFVVAPLFEGSPVVWRDVGLVDDFAEGTTSEVRYEDATSLPWAGVSARTAAWLRRIEGEDFVAFSVNCTHLGCPVRWLQQANLFMCPCHGGVYYHTGDVAAGPPPHPLPRYPVQVVTKDYKTPEGEVLRDRRVVQVQASPVPITTV